MGRRFLIALAAGWLVASEAAAEPRLLDPGLRLEEVVAPEFGPVSLVFLAPDDFLVLRWSTGEVMRSLDDVLLPDPVLDLDVHFLAERGALGLTVDPDFVNNRFVYVFYTENSTAGDTSDPAIVPLANRVYRYFWNGATLVDPVLILDLPVLPGATHNGGVIDFGPDDLLYVVIGDLLHFGQLTNFAGGAEPDDSAVLFRVRPDGSAPPDGPFRLPGQPASPMDRYYAYGIRNSFGFGFDPVTGDVWDTENGPERFDEINRVEPGFNSGWAQIIGPEAEAPGGLGQLWVAPGSSYSDPEFSWRVPVAPTAITFVASRRLGCDLEHDMVVGDAVCGQLYRFELDATRTALDLPPELADRVADNTADPCHAELDSVRLGEDFSIVSDIVNGPDGRLYVVAYARGLVFRVSLAPGAVPDADGDEVDDACDCNAADATAWTVPREVPRLRLAGRAPTTLGWDSQAGTAGPGSTSTVTSGELGALRSSGSYATAACTLAVHLAEPRLADPRPDPPPGEGYFYLVRTGNACGAGSYGGGSSVPDPRDALDASDPPPCPGP
jgi:glucose/arabinose dehydrogenase